MKQTTALLDSQKEAIEKLGRLKVGALFMEPGTGKTLTAIKLVESTNCKQAVFLVPFQTRENLKAELVKWDFKTKYFVYGIESLSNSDRLYLEILNKLKEEPDTFLIVDESLKIKNIRAKRSKRILEFAPLAKYRLILNGTPISKNLLDIWSQMQFLSPKILGMSYTQFKDIFCEYVEYRYRRYDGSTSGWQSFVRKHVNVDYLYSLIDPYVFDAKLELNAHKLYIDVPFRVEENYSRYEDLKVKFLQSFTGDPDSFLKFTQMMQRSYCSEPSKLAALEQILDDDTIIFVKFLQSRDAILEKYPHAKVYTYGKGSFGLNLQRYSKLVFFDKTFDYAQKDQAEHRIFRYGQKKDVTYYDFTGNVNLEKTIDKNIYNKITLLDLFKKLANEGDEKWENII